MISAADPWPHGFRHLWLPLPAVDRPLTRERQPLLDRRLRRRVVATQPETRCPSCRHRNRPGRHFCTECGSRLGRACEVCGAVVEPSEKFCGSCGTALREDAAVPGRTE